MSTNNEQPTNNSSQQGIDVREALHILSLRNPEEHGHSHDHHHQHSSLTACHEAPTKDAVNWGQRIDLGASESSSSNATSQEEAVANIEKQKEQLEKERAERRAVIEKKLETMSISELLQCVMNSQEQRVATYRSYDKCVIAMLLLYITFILLNRHPGSKLSFLFFKTFQRPR